MRLFRPSWSTILPPLLLILLAFVPSGFIRQFFYGLLAIPLMPAIKRLGLLYRDIGFLAPVGAIFTAVVWAVFLYLVLCGLRYVRSSRV